MDLLTHSAMSSFKSCRRKYYYAYEVGIRPAVDAKALRIGSAVHAAMEVGSLEGAVGVVASLYGMPPAGFDEYWWNIEGQTVMTLVLGYYWRWATSQITTLEPEFKFELPLTNPATGHATPLWMRGGKIDGIVRLADGRLAIREMKTTSDDVTPDSPVWRRLRIDHQITHYTVAARDAGYDVATVLYDVIRKPTIEATPVALRDADGLKIVRDANGNRVMTKQGKPRQTASSEEGFTLVTRPMTPAEWHDKLVTDIYSRPDYYYARVEIPRLDADLDEYRFELWDIQKTIRDAQLNNRWYRTVDRNTCQYCSYFNICADNVAINPDGSGLPDGMKFLGRQPHPELENTDAPTRRIPLATSAAGPAAGPATPAAEPVGGSAGSDPPRI